MQLAKAEGNAIQICTTRRWSPSLVSDGKPDDGEPQMATRTYPSGF
jgi:hypothetical protein